MASFPIIYTIQASDAPKHTDRLRDILQMLEIEKRISALLSDQPGLRVAEILVDNLIYDNDYIKFPTDPKPIRLDCHRSSGTDFGW